MKGNGREKKTNSCGGWWVNSIEYRGLQNDKLDLGIRKVETIQKISNYDWSISTDPSWGLEA